MVIPVECAAGEIGEGIVDLVVLGCSDGWALTQAFTSCNGDPCVASDLWAVWSPRPDDDLYAGFDGAPYSYCRDYVRSEGAPDWLIATVPFPDCTGTVAPLEFRAEPATGPLSLGDVGPRVAMFQAQLVDGEFSVGGIDGRFGRRTARAVRQLQANLGVYLADTTIGLGEVVRNDGACLGTLGDTRIGISGIDAASPICATAIERWPDVAASSNQFASVDFGDGWICQRESRNQDWAPALVGSCSVDERSADRQTFLRIYQVAP